MLDQNPDFFWNVCLSDEATFISNGSLNRHNCHYWSPENPHWYREVLNQHHWSLHVWVGICNGQVIGPHFFERTINGQMYLEFLENDLPGYLENIPLAIRLNLWYQQDGAPAHYARIVRTFLNQQFPNRWIGRGGPVLRQGGIAHPARDTCCKKEKECKGCTQGSRWIRSLGARRGKERGSKEFAIGKGVEQSRALNVKARTGLKDVVEVFNILSAGQMRESTRETKREEIRVRKQEIGRRVNAGGFFSKQVGSFVAGNSEVTRNPNKANILTSFREVEEKELNFINGNYRRCDKGKLNGEGICRGDRSMRGDADVKIQVQIWRKDAKADIASLRGFGTISVESRKD
ncbi:hypothetical protein TSAR_006288 [Trichomalopsis sarcophagae]|uniref:DUF4817 domain-containing protein n=1 Tax=Trichomalopsis sarcophagae TaxID=543379 RepID=A0A232EM96_9HYME|nr:hypothetical protein TSAR_006288 [Trichomalopsis sarcophagae]